MEREKSRPDKITDPKRLEREALRPANGQQKVDPATERDPERGQSIGREPALKPGKKPPPERDPAGELGDRKYEGLDRPLPDYDPGRRHRDDFGVERERTDEEWHQPRRLESPDERPAGRKDHPDR